MADGRLADIKGCIVSVLSNEHYLAFIKNTYDKHSSFIGDRYSNFYVTMSFIMNITNEEYLEFIKDYPNSHDIINNIGKYLNDLAESGYEKEYHESDIVTCLVNFYDSASVLERFVKDSRKNNNDSRSNITKDEGTESKRILDELIGHKEEIERIVRDANSKDKDIINILNSININKNKIEGILENIEKENKEVSDILLKTQNTKLLLESAIQSLQSKQIEIKTSLSNIEEEINNSLINRIEEFKGTLNKRVSDANSIFSDGVSNLEKTYEFYSQQLNNRLDIKENSVYKGVETFKEQIFKELHDIDNNIQREQLAYYFYRERRKLKGDIDITIFIYAFILMTFIYWCRGFSLTAFNKYDIFISVLIYMLMIGTIQIIINIVNNIGRILSIKSWKDIFRETTLDSEALVDLDSYNTNQNPDEGDISSKVGNLERDGIGESRYKMRRKSIIIKDIFAQTQFLELFTPYWAWLIATLAGMLSIGAVAYYVFDELKDKQYISYSSLIPYTAGYMLLIWFTWFCSKQFSYTKQICDEYEYKYALSKSYLSYRDEAKQLADVKNNEAILIALLDSIIKNIAQSPVQSVQRDCHTPFSEVFNAVKNVYQVEDGGKKTGK